MDSTLTLCLAKKHRAELRNRARAEKKTESQLARDLIIQNLEKAPMWEDISDLLGSVELPKEPSGPLRKKIRARNWR